MNTILILLYFSIFMLLVAVVIAILIRNRVILKSDFYKTEFDLFKSLPFVVSAQKHLKQKAEIEHQKEIERLALEEKSKRGEAIFPAPMTKKEWIEKEYRVGEEKETLYPERPHPADKK